MRMRFSLLLSFRGHYRFEPALSGRVAVVEVRLRKRRIEVYGRRSPRSRASRLKSATTTWVGGFESHRYQWCRLGVAVLVGLAISACALPSRRGARTDIEASTDPREALLDAVGLGDAAEAREVLRQGGDANQKTPEGAPLLMIAAEDGHEALVEVLLENGAEIDATNEKGVTPLIAAAGTGQVAVLEQLLAHGADPRAVTGSGVSALMGAAAGGHLEVVKILLERQVAIDAHDRAGRTALMFGAANGQTDVVRELVARGARVDVRDQDGDTATSLAKKAKHGEVEALLRPRGAP
jgi:ankyrin repeat protein